MRRPVTTSPPSEVSSATSASVSMPLPPATIGQPTPWAKRPSARPKEALSGFSSGSIEWPDRPANRPCASSVSKRERARPVAERRAGNPKRASASGCRGMCTTGPRSSGASRSISAEIRPNVRRQARPSGAQAGGRRLDRAMHDPGPSAIERVGDRHVRMDERHAAGRQVDRAEERRGERRRVDRRARVVPVAGERQLGGPEASAGRVGRLVDDDGPAGTGERDRRGQPVRPGPDDDGVGSVDVMHEESVAAARPR